MMRRRLSLIWLQGLLCGAMATLATPTTLLLVVLLAPSVLALLLDRKTGKPTARSVALANMAASVGSLHGLWTAGHTMAVAVGLVSDPAVVAAAWSAAAGGWLLAELAPIAVRAALDGWSAARATRLRAERARLSAAWGLEQEADQRGAERGRSTAA
jgi:hypothetical protein